MGHEYCGVVEEVGSAVKSVKPGQDIGPQWAHGTGSEAWDCGCFLPIEFFFGREQVGFWLRPY